MSTEAQTGRLFIVATPIGCLEDISLRALRVLKEVDAILAEDTRHSRKLCSHYGIKTPLHSFHAHSSESKIKHWTEKLRVGAKIALVTDAGTPLVSDPGAVLVERAIAAGVPIEPVPGASAVTAALSVAGLGTQPFRFEGFLARSGSKRQFALERIAKETGASVLFESPQRLGQTLVSLLEAIGPGRQVAVCRELTKMHEEVIRGTLQEVIERLHSPLKGEITLVIQGSSFVQPAVLDDEQVDSWIQAWALQGRSARDMAIDLAERTGLTRREAYRHVLRSRSTAC